MTKEIKFWNSQDLRTALVAIGMLGLEGRLSLHKMPDAIHTQMLSGISKDLIAVTAEMSKRHSQALLVDTENGKLIQGNRTVERNGTIRVDATPSLESTGSQPLIATLRTFNPNVPTFGFNGSAYTSFLTRGTEEFMVMIFGDKYRWAVLKSRATPELTPQSSPEYSVSTIVQEVQTTQAGQSVQAKLAAIHGHIAVHYGLRLYESVQSSASTATDQFVAVNTHQIFEEHYK